VFYELKLYTKKKIKAPKNFEGAKNNRNCKVLACTRWLWEISH